MMNTETMLMFAELAGLHVDVRSLMALERFTTMVRNDKAEECAKLCQEMTAYTGLDCANTIREQIERSV